LRMVITIGYRAVDTVSSIDSDLSSIDVTRCDPTLERRRCRRLPACCPSARREFRVVCRRRRETPAWSCLLLAIFSAQVSRHSVAMSPGITELR
jgi:hypothetical protein